MSYIVAMVRFNPKDSTNYPMNCLRDDIAVGEKVIVRLGSGRLKIGVVETLSFLNWNCSGDIACKLSESDGFDENTIYCSSPFPLVMGLTTHESLFNELINRGWKSYRKATKSFYFVSGFSNGSECAFVLQRNNGIDIQVLDKANYESVVTTPGQHYSISVGRLVRHFLSETRQNLFNFTLEFAKAFQSGPANYDEFFVAQGSRTRVNAFRSRLSSEARDEQSLRNALSDCRDSTGGIYLCDDVYL